MLCFVLLFFKLRTPFFLMHIKLLSSEVTCWFHLIMNLRICINVYSQILWGKWFYWIHFWSIHPADLVYTSFYSWGKPNVNCGLLETNFPLTGLYPSTFADLRFYEGLSFMVVGHNPTCISTLALAALGSRGRCKSPSYPTFSNSLSMHHSVT